MRGTGWTATTATARDISMGDRIRPFGERRIGPHLQLGGGLLKAADRAIAIGATAVQVFADNPTAWRRRTEPPKDIEAFRARLVAHDIGPIAVHAPYLVNLAASDPVMWERSISTMAGELRMGRQYGAFAVNVHIGSHVRQGAERGMAQLAAGLARVLAEVEVGDDVPIIVLENSAGQGDALGTSIEELAAILETAARAGADTDRIGICLDTAHLWGAGVALDVPEAIDRFFDRFDAELDPGRLRMLHFNDSRSACGSRTDRHEHIGAGKIGTAGLRHLVNHPRLARVPAYLETPGMDVGYDAVNLERVRRLIAGDELEPLPPEAFTLRGSRPRSSAPPDAADEATGMAEEAVPNPRMGPPRRAAATGPPAVQKGVGALLADGDPVPPRSARE